MMHIPRFVIILLALGIVAWFANKASGHLTGKLP
jgi:hypothetical protein